MAVKICGAVLSSLFYDHSNSNSDQEGLLLGKVVSCKTDAISDSQISAVKEEISTYVYAYVPCGSSLSWYDSGGRVCTDDLQHFLKKHSPREVIGWYKFRRNSSMLVSLRERSVHKHLKEVFSGIRDQHFLFLLCGMQASSVRQSTYNLDHVFFTCNNRKFGSVGSEIINLGDTAHNEYKMQPSMIINTDSGAFESTMREVSTRLSSSNAVISSESALNCLNTTVEDKLQKLCRDVSSTEEHLGALRREIHEIKAKIRLKEEHTKATFTPLPEPPQALVKSLGTVPKTKLDRISSPATSSSSTRQKRLSSGSSPSQRKILDFEHQESLFDIRGGSKDVRKTEKPVVVDSNAETLEVDMDLICLGDSDGHSKKQQKMDVVNSGDDISNTDTTSKAGNGLSVNNHIRFNSSEENFSQPESPSMLSTENAPFNSAYNVPRQSSTPNTNPFLSSNDSLLLTPQKLYEDKASEKEATDSTLGSKENKTDSFKELESVARSRLKTVPKGSTLPKRTKNVQNTDNKKATNSLQHGASLGNYNDKISVKQGQRSTRGQDEQETTSNGSSFDEVSISDDILAIDSSE